MVVTPYRVFVIVDRDFGERLAALPSEVPVWIVDTSKNKQVAHRLWKERPAESHLTGITTFNDIKGSSAEELFLGIIDTVDLHHGSYSASPPYTIVAVLGVNLTDRIKTELSVYGFSEFQPNSEGFSAIRQLPDATRL